MGSIAEQQFIIRRYSGLRSLTIARQADASHSYFLLEPMAHFSNAGPSANFGLFLEVNTALVLPFNSDT